MNVESSLKSRRGWRSLASETYPSRCLSIVSSLPQQTTVDFVGEALKRDLEGYHGDESPAFPIDEARQITSLSSARSSPMRRLSSAMPCTDAMENKFSAPDIDKMQIIQRLDNFDNYFSNQNLGWLFLKMLVPGMVAEKLLRELKIDSFRSQLLGVASVYISPQRQYFPGTKDRVVAIRSSQMGDIWRISRYLAGLVFEHFQNSLSSSIVTIREDKPMVKVAVPRKVVGTIIGKNGGHIQKLRHSTSAHIHISPLFVADDSACGERVISMTSRDLLSLRTAVYTLAGLINQHPDRANCRRVIYNSQHFGEEIRVTRLGFERNESRMLDTNFLNFPLAQRTLAQGKCTNTKPHTERKFVRLVVAGSLVFLTVLLGAMVGQSTLKLTSVPL